MTRSEFKRYESQVRAQLTEAGIVLPPDFPVEIADFGLGDYARQGLGIVVRVNTPEYCSKFLTLRPGQTCPMHFHQLKTETFFALRGTVWLRVDGQDSVLQPGQQFTLKPGQKHTFGSVQGAVVEEVSTHDENFDSYFDDPAIVRDPVMEED